MRISLKDNNRDFLLNNMQFELLLPKKIIFGAGSVEKVGEEARNLSGKSTLIVTSRGMRKWDGLKKVIKVLDNEGISSEVFYEVDPEPPIENVYKCMKSAEGCDLIIGLGGGSVIDVAKKKICCRFEFAKGNDTNNRRHRERSYT